MPIYARLRKTSTDQGATERGNREALAEGIQKSLRYSYQMLWIFECKGEQMTCEIRREGVGAGYEMVVTNADGSQRMERFEETADLIKRTLDLQGELLESGWRQPK